ncbi:hypothetical protein [Streptomyces sp. NPDC048442]|uniref:hypothetical protein n=1 Tax=Streptomyces sp. NPDC048442 TaxID=3154823 RepID=UPI003449F109
MATTGTDRLLDLLALLAEHERTEARARAGLLTPEECRHSHIMGIYLADRLAEVPLPSHPPAAVAAEAAASRAHFQMMSEALVTADGASVDDPYTYARQQHALLCWTEHSYTEAP